jgi:hypothetical protein
MARRATQVTEVTGYTSLEAKAEIPRIEPLSDGAQPATQGDAQ